MPGMRLLAWAAMLLLPLPLAMIGLQLVFTFNAIRHFHQI
jgi:hypothetical protein